LLEAILNPFNTDNKISLSANTMSTSH